jgi:hypothetical protein
MLNISYVDLKNKMIVRYLEVKLFSNFPFPGGSSPPLKAACWVFLREEQLQPFKIEFVQKKIIKRSSLFLNIVKKETRRRTTLPSYLQNLLPSLPPKSVFL